MNDDPARNRLRHQQLSRCFLGFAESEEHNTLCAGIADAMVLLHREIAVHSAFGDAPRSWSEADVAFGSLRIDDVHADTVYARISSIALVFGSAFSIGRPLS